jgi:hypothetical protein
MDTHGFVCEVSNMVVFGSKNFLTNSKHVIITGEALRALHSSLQCLAFVCVIAGQVDSSRHGVVT